MLKPNEQKSVLFLLSWRLPVLLCTNVFLPRPAKRSLVCVCVFANLVRRRNFALCASSDGSAANVRRFLMGRLYS